MIRPTQNPLTPGYGFGSILSPYSASSPHKGVDFLPTPDNRIYMPEDGVVQQVPNNGDCGNAIHIYVGNRHHALCHTSQYLTPNSVFQKQGTPVAVMGATGNASGVHLHWALTIDNVLVDPLKQVIGVAMIEPQTVISTFADFDAGVPTASQIKYYGSHPGGYDELHKDLALYNLNARHAAEVRVKELEAQIAAGSSGITKNSVIAYITANLK